MEARRHSRLQKSHFCIWACIFSSIYIKCYPFPLFGYSTPLTLLSLSWKSGVWFEISNGYFSIANHFSTVYLVLWRWFTSADPAFLSLTVFNLSNSVALLLIGYLKLSDVVNTGTFHFSTRYDFLTAEIWPPLSRAQEPTPTPQEPKTIQVVWSKLVWVSFWITKKSDSEITLSFMSDRTS